jgi:hypothetical protein
MIGWKAMGFLVFPVFCLILLTFLFAGAVLPQGPQWSVRRRAAIAFMCMVGGAYFSAVVAFHMIDFWRVRNFRPENILEITVGDRVLTSDQNIASICSVLHETEWFEAQHGGWTQELVMTFKTRTGDEYRYRIGYYKVHPGAVILHRIGGERSYLLGTVGFNAQLPDVLSRWGISLPH